MIAETLLVQVGLAALGGAGAELLHWYLLARKPEGIEAYRKMPLYWATTVGMVALGALMPVLYLNGPASALLCFHLGAATPLLLQKLVSSAPAIVRTMGVVHSRAARGSLVRFLDW